MNYPMSIMSSIISFDMNHGRLYPPDPHADSRPIIKSRCPECKKRFSRDKLKSHVESEHYLCTRNAQQHYLNEEDEIRIYYAASQYLRDILGGRIFPRLSGDQRRFLERLKETRALIECDWRRVFKDFHDFISMGLPYYDTNFCPTLHIDFIWHAVIVNDLIDLNIPHCAKERTEQEDQLRYDYFCKVFLAKTQRFPYTKTVTANTVPASTEEMYQVADQLKALADQLTQKREEAYEHSVQYRIMVAQKYERQRLEAKPLLPHRRYNSGSSC